MFARLFAVVLLAIAIAMAGTAFAEKLAVVPVGFHSTDAGRTELLAIQVDDPIPAERMAYRFRAFGPWGIDGNVWVRSGDAGWKKVSYRRPKNLDEGIAFIENPEAFRSEETFADAAALPFLLGRLGAEVLRDISFIVVYFAGGAYIHLMPEMTNERAEVLMRAIAANLAQVEK
ncbi:MAG: hypothetical protein HYY60_00740 [Parcubacteria group bacterium]|nr:hypothetical protein [Parcubacteria group bacterium]